MKIRPVGAVLHHTDTETDGQEDTGKLIVAFRNFSEVTNKTYNNNNNNIFKPTIGNESLHLDSNDNGVRIVNFATSK